MTEYVVNIDLCYDPAAPCIFLRVDEDIYFGYDDNFERYSGVFYKSDIFGEDEETRIFNDGKAAQAFAIFHRGTDDIEPEDIYC